MDKEKAEEQKVDENVNDENQEEEEVLTISDLVKINDSLEAEAEALLGGHSESVCTYPEFKGYKYRQPLYSCLTCAAENDDQLAGVCYGCSSNCHDGHDLVELYTKRKFCCDCGNSKFKSKCKLYEEKCDTNPLNKYNDNFKRIYCTCKKVYPPVDSDDNADAGEMHQCCICEDWFHLSHIFEEPALSDVVEKLQSEDADENWELLCKDCVAKFPFLMHYEADIKAKNSTDEAPDGKRSLANGGSEVPTAEKPNEDVENSSVPASNGTALCKLYVLKQKHSDKVFSLHSIYMDPSWRDSLCRCFKCMDMYEEVDCAFLVDPEDTFAHYDAERKRVMELNGETPAADPNPNDSSSKSLGSGIENLMYNIVVKKTNNRDAALNAYMGVKQMYSHLGEFFSKRGESRAITRRDVEQCFEELKAKRPRFSSPNEDSAAWTQ